MKKPFLIETEIMETMRKSEYESQADTHAKEILGNKYLLAWILKESTEEYKGYSIAEIKDYIEGEPEISIRPVMAGEKVQGMKSEDSSATEGLIRFDILFYARLPQNGLLIKLIVNVEAQADFFPGYPLTKRGIYYTSRLISSQKGTEFTGSDYGNIAKVYSIWVCMNAPKEWQNTITRYAMTEQNVIGNIKQDPANYDLTTVVLICLGEGNNDRFQGILKLLGTVLSEDIDYRQKMETMEKDFGIPRTKRLERQVYQMCNISQGIKRKGIEQGIERGIEQGIEKGKWLTMIDTAKRFLAMGLSIEQVAEGTELPIATVADLANGKEINWDDSL